MKHVFWLAGAGARGSDGTAFRAIPRPAFTSVDAGAGGLSKFLQNFEKVTAQSKKEYIYLYQIQWEDNKCLELILKG